MYIIEPEIGNPRVARVPAVIRAFDVLEYLAEVTAANPSEAARDLKLPRTGVLRILVTLTELGYTWRESASGRYRLTTKLFCTGSQADTMDLARIARPHLVDLRDKSGETAELAVIDGQELLLIDTLDSPASIRLHARPGRRFPLYRMATGRVLLAGLDQTAVRRMFDKGKLETEPFVIERGIEGLQAKLSEIAEKGYALDERHARDDVERIAAPVYGPDDCVIGAVGIAGPVFRLSPNPTSIALVRAAAESISRDVGSAG